MLFRFLGRIAVLDRFEHEKDQVEDDERQRVEKCFQAQLQGRNDEHGQEQQAVGGHESDQSAAL